MTEVVIRHYTRTIIIHHHQWGRNRYWECYLHGNLMVSNRSPITSQTITGIRTARAIWNTRSERWVKIVFNGWIHWLHNHSWHVWPNLGGTDQKRGIIGNKHHILSISNPRDSKSGRPSITPQFSRVMETCSAQDMSGMVPIETLIMGTPLQRNVFDLGKWHKGAPIINTNKKIQTGIPHWKDKSCHTHHPYSTLLSHKITSSTKKG